MERGKQQVRERTLGDITLKGTGGGSWAKGRKERSETQEEDRQVRVCTQGREDSRKGVMQTQAEPGGPGDRPSSVLWTWS